MDEELLPGIRLERSDSALVIRTVEPLQVLSTAVLGGGRRSARTIVNLHVPSGYACVRPERDLREFTREHALPAPVVGLMTAAELCGAQLLRAEEDGIVVCALLTAGLTNATRAGVRGALDPSAGTINAIFLCNARLRDAAALELVAIAAESKAATLVEAGVRTREGRLASGTSTDAVVIAWRADAPRPIRFAGSATVIGSLVGRLMREGIETHLAGLAGGQKLAPWNHTESTLKVAVPEAIRTGGTLQRPDGHPREAGPPRRRAEHGSPRSDENSAPRSRGPRPGADRGD